MAKKSSSYKTGGMTNPNKASIKPAPKGIGPSSPVKKFKVGGPTIKTKVTAVEKATPTAKAVIGKGKGRGVQAIKAAYMKKGGSTKKKMDMGGTAKIRNKAENKNTPRTTYNPTKGAPGKAEIANAVAGNKEGMKNSTTVTKKAVVKTPVKTNFTYDELYAIAKSKGQDALNNFLESTKPKSEVRLKSEIVPTIREKSAPITTSSVSTVKIPSTTTIPSVSKVGTVSTKSQPVAVKRKRPRKDMGGMATKKANVLGGMEFGMPEENMGINSMKKGGSAKHPGFKAIQSKIAKQSGVSKKAAGAILASASRNASKSAKSINPRLKRVKG